MCRDSHIDTFRGRKSGRSMESFRVETVVDSRYLVGNCYKEAFRVRISSRNVNCVRGGFVSVEIDALGDEGDVIFAM